MSMPRTGDSLGAILIISTEAARPDVIVVIGQSLLPPKSDDHTVSRAREQRAEMGAPGIKDRRARTSTAEKRSAFEDDACLRHAVSGVQQIDSDQGVGC